MKGQSVEGKPRQKPKLPAKSAWPLRVGSAYSSSSCTSLYPPRPCMDRYREGPEQGDDETGWGAELVGEL